MAPRRYHHGRRDQGREVLVVALPGAKDTSRNPKSSRADGSEGRDPVARRTTPKAKDDGWKNPFDVHPKKFKNYRLIWEIYKSERE